MKRKDNFRMVLGNIGDVIYIDICYVLKFLFKDYKIKSHHISFQNQEIIINIKLENAEVNFAYDGCNRFVR